MILRDGRVLCWGQNFRGQLGGEGENRAVAVAHVVERRRLVLQVDEDPAFLRLDEVRLEDAAALTYVAATLSAILTLLYLLLRSGLLGGSRD